MAKTSKFNCILHNPIRLFISSIDSEALFTCCRTQPWIVSHRAPGCSDRVPSGLGNRVVIGGNFTEYSMVVKVLAVQSPATFWKAIVYLVLRILTDCDSKGLTAGAQQNSVFSTDKQMPRVLLTQVGNLCSYISPQSPGHCDELHCKKSLSPPSFYYRTNIS